MSSFNANSQTFNVVTENELAVVLSHYSSEFIFSILDVNMKSRFYSVPIAAMPNVVGAWEQNFKAIMAQYGSESNPEVLRVRNETYREIIDAICKEFGLNFTIEDSIDLYSAAYQLYSFLVCSFTDNMTSFFANFIYKERSALYEALDLTALKKNKDSSTIYGKKIYKDIKLAVINANIDKVITEVCNMEIPFYSIVNTIFGANSELKRYLLNIVSADYSFFKRAYIPVLESDIRPDIITAIRFKLQEIAIAHDQTASAADLIPAATDRVNKEVEDDDGE